MAVETYRIRGNKDPVSGRYLWDGLVRVRDGVCVSTAPVWGHLTGFPLEAIKSKAQQMGYLMERQEANTNAVLTD